MIQNIERNINYFLREFEVSFAGGHVPVIGEAAPKTDHAAMNSQQFNPGQPSCGICLWTKGQREIRMPLKWRGKTPQMKFWEENWSGSKHISMVYFLVIRMIWDLAANYLDDGLIRLDRPSSLGGGGVSGTFSYLYNSIPRPFHIFILLQLQTFLGQPLQSD